MYLCFLHLIVIYNSIMETYKTDMLMYKVSYDIDAYLKNKLFTIIVLLLITSVKFAKNIDKQKSIFLTYFDCLNKDFTDIALFLTITETSRLLKLLKSFTLIFEKNYSIFFSAGPALLIFF